MWLVGQYPIITAPLKWRRQVLDITKLEDVRRDRRDRGGESIDRKKGNVIRKDGVSDLIVLSFNQHHLINHCFSITML